MSAAFEMPPEEFVQALYRALLGRPADPGGLEHYIAMIDATGDPTKVVRSILSSNEYADRPAVIPDCKAEATRALDGIRRRLRIVDVGAQAFGVHAYEGLLRLCDHEIIGFDPLQQKLQERAEQEGHSNLKLLPYAVGDGSTRRFHINNVDATSSIFPLNTQLNSTLSDLTELRTVRTELLQTHRLDDVLPEGPVDFLMLDVQGAELLVLQDGTATLARTACVHCEVEFAPLYAGQPLIDSVHRFLNERGFTMIDLLVAGRHSYVTPSRRTGQDRLLEADAVYFRDTDDPETLRVQALIAAAVYHKPSFAEYLLTIASGNRGS
jgi:FkbM family methyltransferase